MLQGTVTDSMDAHFAGLTADELIQWGHEEFADTVAVSTSFGIQSAITLHLAVSIKPDIPVIWVDTGYLPAQTHDYRRTLTRLLNLNLHVYRSPITPREMEQRFGRLWESQNVEDLDRYDQIRKVEPMHRALGELNIRGWISGLRAEQTEYRKRLPRVKRKGSLYRIYPILNWTARDVYFYMRRLGLPQHPLFELGYTTVGDVHSSRPLAAEDTHERDTRFRGLKQECGLHLS
ncbi:MAG: phosphoadenylyl-sulfate reductase [Pirellulales bacterium]|nr:phosphoadenylyl-sulfate reductase [Pirellulales bacterium]